MNFYNDMEPTVYAWLRRLVAAGHLPAGDVNPAPVQLLTPASLAGYTSAHFFAGIGGWPLALRMAGWPDDEPVWTASLPCQPFSNAGRRLGDKDERHLWPVFRSLVAECRPPVIFGEQVASRAGREWLAGVRADLEALGYAVGAADLCAAGVGAPHIRQRLFWVAHAHLEVQGRGRILGPGESQGAGLGATRERPAGLCATGGLGHPLGQGLAGRPGLTGDDGPQRTASERAGSDVVGVAHTDQHGRGPRSEATEAARHGYSFGPASWAGADWHLCLDGKHRRVPLEPELFPLAHGVSGRVGQLRAYGNAIVPQVAATFVKAFMDVRP